MSDIAVTVTSPGSVNATIGVGGAVSATVSSGGSVAVQLPSGSFAWGDISGKPTEFTPAAHTHKAADITDRSTALVTSVNGQTGDITITEGGGGASLSDVPPQVLGNVSAGTGLLASRDDHVHPMPTAADVGALDENSVIDGGNYVGVIVIPSQAIQITSQPASQTVYVVASAATWSATEQTTNQPPGGGRSQSLLSDGTTAVFLASAGIWSSDNAGSSWSLSSRTWTNSISGEEWLIAGYGNGKWVVVDVSGKVSYTAASSPTNSASWTETANNGFEYIPDGSLFRPLGGQRRIVFGNGLYLAASREQVSNWTDGSGNSIGSFLYNRMQRSTDGTIWTAVNPPSGSTGIVETFSYDPSRLRFVMACLDNSLSASYAPQRTYRIYYSDDGTAWTEATVPTMSSGTNLSINTRSVAAFGVGKFVIKPNYHISDVFVSSDGVTWTKHTGPGFVVNDMHYDGSFFVAIGEGAYATSPDGVTWTERAAPAAGTSWRSSSLVGTKTIARRELDGYSTNSTLVIDRTITDGGASASFSVSAYISSGTLTYQWEVSSDAGSSWSSVSGATAAALSLTGLTQADSGDQYRAIVSAVGSDSVTSNAATLTVL